MACPITLRLEWEEVDVLDFVLQIEKKASRLIVRIEIEFDIENLLDQAEHIDLPLERTIGIFFIKGVLLQIGKLIKLRFEEDDHIDERHPFFAHHLHPFADLIPFAKNLCCFADPISPQLAYRSFEIGPPTSSKYLVQEISGSIAG